MRQINLVLMVFLLAGISYLAAEPWQLDSDVMVNLTQSAYSNNWNGNERSSITWTAASNTSVQKQLAEWLKNKTTLKLAFGQTYRQVGQPGNYTWEKPEKSTDKIDLEALFQFTLKSFVDPYLAGRMESQFLDEREADNTILINPLLFTESAGIMKTILDREKTKLSARLGGAIRENVDRNVLPAHTLETTVDGGVEGVVEFKQVLESLNASYNAKLSAYQALFNSKSETVDADWKALDWKLENLLSFKLFKVLSLNLALDLLYEKEQDTAVQWKEILGIGFSYTLF